MLIGIGIRLGGFSGSRILDQGLWDDLLAVNGAGFTYNGDHTWTSDGTTGDLYIANAAPNGSTCTFIIEVLEYTSGTVEAKLEGTVDQEQRISSTGVHEVTITDTSGFTHTGLLSELFIGRVKIHSIVEIV